MANTLSTVTHSTSGLKTWTIGYQATRARLKVVPAPGGTASDVRYSDGVTDGTNQVCDQESVYASNRRQQRYTDRIASVWEYSGGSWTEVFKAELDSFTATEVKYNVTTPNANYQVLREAEG